MATPADQRLLELLDKWLKSLELHARYSSLDDDSYWKIQEWVEHQRPSRWIVDLAMQKTVALRTQVEERMKSGDAKYSDSLELMIFLANLVGSDHIERFIPLAAAENERTVAADRPDAASAAGRRRPEKCRVPRRQTRRRPRDPRLHAPNARQRHPSSRRQTGTSNPRLATSAADAAAQSGAGRQACGQGRRQSWVRRSGRPRRLRGRRARASHCRCGSTGTMGTQVVRVARAYRAHGGSPGSARSTAYTQREQIGHRREGRSIQALKARSPRTAQKILNLLRKCTLKGAHDHDE